MIRRYVTVFILLFTTLAASSANAASVDEARQFVDKVGQSVLDVINGAGNASQKQAQLREMFAENVDIDWMARFVLGPGWQQASEEQRSHYMQAYKQYLLAHYTTNFSNYTGSKYTITDVKSEENGQFTVNMRIKTAAAQQDTLAGYRLRSEDGNGGQFKIIDIIIEGVSLITTQRSDFTSVFQQKGMDGLISTIEAKTKTENK